MSRFAPTSWSELSASVLASELEAKAPAGTVIVAAPIKEPAYALFPEEVVAVVDAVTSRALEFASGRACARAALARLGFAPCAVPVGPGRLPIFPPGVTGSIAHSGSVCIAAAVPNHLVTSVGVDIEVASDLPEPIARMVCLPKERRMAAIGDLGPSWAVLHFSAKEAVYKARQGVAPGWLGFEDVELAFTDGGRSFRAAVARPGHHSRFLGRSVVCDGVVATLAWPE